MNLKDKVPAYEATHEYIEGETRKLDGQPTKVSLTRFDGDAALRGGCWTVCCDCGLTHLVVYELYCEDGDWTLITRDYRGD